MILRQITDFLDSLAPPVYQESYDNAGLIVGEKDMEINQALICLDATEDVIDEAMGSACNLVISHHPVIFSGIKKINNLTYTGRTLIKAIKNDIAIFAVHTNLDNVLHGVNHMISEKLGLQNVEILQPKEGSLLKLNLFYTENHKNVVEKLLQVRQEFALYDLEDLIIFDGRVEDGALIKREIAIPINMKSWMLHELNKLANEFNIRYELLKLDNPDIKVGSGMIGGTEKEMDETEFLKHIQEKLDCNTIKYTNLLGKKVSKVALCGGSGSFLLPWAISMKADFFISADFKYHQFFDANGKIVIADIGHYESEKFTSQLLHGYLSKKFPNFAFRLSQKNTNPINYYN